MWSSAASLGFAVGLSTAALMYPTNESAPPYSMLKAAAAGWLIALLICGLRSLTNSMRFAGLGYLNHRLFSVVRDTWI